MVSLSIGVKDVARHGLAICRRKEARIGLLSPVGSSPTQSSGGSVGGWEKFKVALLDMQSLQSRLSG